MLSLSYLFETILQLGKANIWLPSNQQKHQCALVQYCLLSVIEKDIKDQRTVTKRAVMLKLREDRSEICSSTYTIDNILVNHQPNKTNL